jgi:hypothetical protein
LQEANPVFNLGIGYEWYFAADVSLYGSFTTDFSAATADLSRIMEDPFRLYTTNNRMNIYHAGVGIGLSLKNWELTVGTMFSFGNYQIEQLITLPPEGGIELPPNEQENIARAEFRQLRFLLGISFDL